MHLHAGYAFALVIPVASQQQNGLLKLGGVVAVAQLLQFFVCAVGGLDHVRFCSIYVMLHQFVVVHEVVGAYVLFEKGQTHYSHNPKL